MVSTRTHLKASPRAGPLRVALIASVAALVAAFKPETRRTCAWYFASVKRPWFRIRHVLDSRDTHLKAFSRTAINPFAGLPRRETVSQTM